MNSTLNHIIRFILLVLVQVFVLNQLEFGWGILIVVYPLFIFLLPYSLNLSFTLLLAFLMGFCVDVLSNTFGLHTSSLLVFAYLRPYIFSKFASQEEYESNNEANIYTMGRGWFTITFTLLIFLQLLWFFLFEVANLNDTLYVLQKTILSTVTSFLFCIGLQIIFVQKPKER